MYHQIMMIEALKLINLPVAAEDTLSKVGSIRQIVVDPANGHILGFLVAPGGFFAKLKVLSIVDVKFWDPAGLVTAYENNLVNLLEIVRIKNVLDRKIDLIQMPAQTESGKSLGQVDDFLIDTDTESIVKYYLKDLLGKTRVMPADKVISIDKKIVFADDAAVEAGGIPSGSAVEAQTA